MTYTPPPNSPPWLIAAAREIGFHESGNNRGIAQYIALAHCGMEGEPWCAIFANAMLESVGVKGTRSASSQSFAHSPLFHKIDNPVIGALAVFWRGSPHSGVGHVGFATAINPHRDAIWVLGGNEQDAVRNELLPLHANTFGLVGYYMPEGWSSAQPVPTITDASELNLKVT